MIIEKKPAVYIAGKVTGLERQAVKEKFALADFLLRRKGYYVYNPIMLCEPTMSWEEAMRICIRKLTYCDAIYMLSDWQDSKGARIEKQVAESMGLKIYYAGVQNAD